MFFAGFVSVLIWDWELMFDCVVFRVSMLGLVIMIILGRYHVFMYLDPDGI